MRMRCRSASASATPGENTARRSPAPPTLPPVESSPTPIPPTSVPPAATATSPGATNQRPNGLPLTAAFLGAPPIIDGNLAEWTSNAYNVSQIVHGAALWSGGSDLSASLYLGWDNDNLYIAARVRDDAFVQNSRGSQIYLGDEVEIQLDADLAGDFASSSLTSDDYQIGLSPGNFGSVPPEAYRWSPAGISGALSSVDVAASSTGQGYDLEARIPWAVFNVIPSTGARFGFTFSISDNDQTGTSVQQSMVSTVSTRTLLDPTSWGTLVLGDATGS